jgi:deoxyribodipyrimidine photo-lyase
LGYPKPHVDWKETKARALDRFKRGLRNADV